MEQLVLAKPEFPIVSSEELKKSVFRRLVSASQESPSVSVKVVVEVEVEAEAEGSTLSPAMKVMSVTEAMMTEENV